MVIVEFLFFIVGFIFLLKGADLLVDGASSMAAKFNISQIVIGLTIVSFGTSAPELVVNVVASVKGNSDITIGNVVGSNIANVLLILGISSIIYPVQTKKNTVWREIPFALLSSIILLIIVNDVFFEAGNNLISRGDGIILLLFFVVFMTYVFAISKETNTETPNIKLLSFKKSLVYVILGIVGLVIGGKLIVDSAIVIAKLFSVSETLIGLTLVAVGTSLPELATSAVAAFRKNSDIAIGNVVGSNIFNIFFILGISATINPIPFNFQLNFDLLLLLAISLLLFITMFTGTKRTIDRWEGAVFVLMYAFYIIRFFVWGV